MGNNESPITKRLFHHGSLRGGWSSGFVMALSKRWKEPESRYKTWHLNNEELFGVQNNPFKLGRVQYFKVDHRLWVGNMIAQSDPGGFEDFPPIRYQSLEECFMRIRANAVEGLANDAIITFHGPRFGSALAGGKWSKVIGIMERVFEHVDIEFHVYDLEEIEGTIYE